MVTRSDLDLVIRRLFALKAPKAGSIVSKFAMTCMKVMIIGFPVALQFLHPEVFITIILLLSWTEFYQNRDLLDTVDCFAGAARIAKISRCLGRKAVALDVGYHPNKKVFDFNSSAGYTLLDLSLFNFHYPRSNPIGIPKP